MGRFFTILFVLINMGAFCQGVSISPSGSTPDPSAGLDVNFTNKGLLMPRLSQVQRDSIHSPALGLIIFNTTTNCMDMYGFGNWQAMSCLCSGPPSAPGTITGDTSVCSNSNNIVYTAVPVSGANSYTWTVPSGAAIIAGQGTSSITVDFGTSSGNIAVSANNNCGTSGATILAVTINNIPSTPGSITGGSSACSNTGGNVYSISSVSGASSYIWQVPSDAIVTNGQGTNTATISFGTVPGNVTVAAHNNCGTSSASILPVSINNIPSTPGAITGSTLVCANSGGNIYSINSVAGATTYTWTGPFGSSVTGGQGTTSATLSFGSSSGNVSVTADNACGNSAANTLAVNVSSGGTGNQIFNYTGSLQTFSVPGCVTSITITAYGAQGGNHNSGVGGYGGSASGQLAVTPGQVLNIYVGGQGGNPQTAGYNGGGAAGTSEGSGGGGASDVRVAGTDLGSRVIVAAGGGGAGYITNGGSGGGTTGGTGGGPYPATGGTQSGGGSKGTDLCGYGNPTDGTLGQGGNGAAGGCGEGSGGGGGGGYYGGGGGGTGNQGTSSKGSGGGGGSSYTGGVTNGSTSTGVQSGNGQVVLTW